METTRKHADHMSLDEKQLLLLHIQSIPKWRRTHHLTHRLAERTISFFYVREAIRYGRLIEFNYESGCKRVLVRGQKVHRGRQVCVVLDLDNHRIVTAYWNHVDDMHVTLDASRYKETLDIFHVYQWHASV